MSSLFRTALLCLLLIPAACGFQPVHGVKQQATLSNIRVEEIPGRPGQLLKNYIEDEIGEAGEGRYSLHIDYNLQSIPVITELEGVAERYRLVLRAGLALTDNETGQVVLRDTLSRQASYNVSESDYSTFIAGRSAEEMALRELANDIILRLSAILLSIHENPVP